MFNSQSLQSRQLIQHIRQKKTGILALNPENQKENKNKKKDIHSRAERLYAQYRYCLLYRNKMV